MASLSFAEAACRALAQEMRRDPSIWVLGEDVRMGGIFGQYKGLFEEFGPLRVVNTPISESTIMGAGLGAALVGTRPVVEMRIADFAMPAMDEVVNQIAKVRYMFGGQARARVVVRMPHGMLKASGAQHSQIVESWFVNLPGVVVLAPATAADMAGLLMSALRCDDPVMLFEPKSLWWTKEEVAEPLVPQPIGKAREICAGDDITLVAWSQTVAPASQAATRVREKGIGCHLLDLRSLWPWDQDAVARSAMRTKRLVIVQEAPLAAGFGAEVAAAIVERVGPGNLRALKRLGAPRVPVPFAPILENELVQTPDKIEAALLAAML
jgi:acetoin:2,6-dichlorophenolindophenol oxidoreductase subunit beta